jgi:hypothetical protein
MVRVRNFILACLTAVAISIALVPVLEWAGDFSCEGTAYAAGIVDTVAAAIRTLQPAADEERAQRLASLFVTAAEPVGLDPLIPMVIARRESSFFETVERLEVLGTARRERGLMQNHGVALRFRPAGCPATLEGAECQIETGTRFLAFCRDTCPGSTWRWVAYYGRRSCPSEAEARRDRNANIAASLYARVGGTEWR